jgi:diguanylate cyclase (GGDEF)-like protein/PAS domain S-box-containing protein
MPRDPARALLGCLALAALGSASPTLGAVELPSGLQNHDAVMLLIDPATGGILSANEAADRFYGYAPGQLESMRIQQLNSLTEAQVQEEMKLASEEAREYFVFRHRLADGAVRSVEVRSSPMPVDGSTALLSVITDVSDREQMAEALGHLQAHLEETIAEQTLQLRRSSELLMATLAVVALGALVVISGLWRSRRRILHTEAEVEAQRQRLENVIRATDIGTWEWNLVSGRVSVNTRFWTLLGRGELDSEAATIEDLAALVVPDDLEESQATLIAHLRGETAYINHELRVTHADGHWIWLRVRGSVVRRDSSGRALILAGATRDVTSLRNSKDHLYQLANYDALTGLLNRSAFLGRLRGAMESAKESKRRLAVVFVDLDDFKPINDRYGHEIGDEVLVKVGKRMLEALRDTDVIARIGGDEFVALITGIEESSDALAVYQRLLSAASETLLIENQRISLGASMGTTVYPQESEVDADQLLRQADQAMYEAKNSGKNRMRRFSPKLREAEQDQAARSVIREALSLRQFELHYQPKVDMRRGRLIGAEALLRWEHPERGLIMPGAFLPELKSAEEIVAIGEWALREALRQCSAWFKEGFSCPVAVNIDVLQFKRPDFVTQLGNLLGEFPELPDGHLELEILETGALEDDMIASGALRRCKELGVRVSLDDFGTGFSSLSYLKSVPADTLKIDRSFVISMLSNPHDLSIIKGVLGLAQAFHRDVIAEGVESEEHGRLLLRLGCEHAQGYFIARAMPARDFRKWSSHWRAPDSWARTVRIPREEQLILYALVEVRHWIQLLTDYEEGRSRAMPALQVRNGLSSWLQGQAARRLRSEPELLQLHRTQDDLRALIEETFRGSDGAAQASREGIHELREHCSKAEQQLLSLIERNAIVALGNHLSLVQTG